MTSWPKMYLSLLLSAACGAQTQPMLTPEATVASQPALLKILSSRDTQAPALNLESIARENANQILWDKEAILTWEKSGTKHPVVHSFDQQGHDTLVVIEIPQAAAVKVASVASGVDGALLACGSAVDSAGHQSGFIYQASRDRTEAKVIRMSGFYYPDLIAATPDGSVWVKGWEPTDVVGRRIVMDAAVVRRFNREGVITGEYLKQRDALGSMPRGRLTSTFGVLASSASRVGWQAGMAPAPYYEFLLDGTLTEYPGVPMDPLDLLIGLAITDRGDVYASVDVPRQSVRSAGSHLYRLNRQVPRWDEVTLPKGPESAGLRFLRGAAGNALVFSTNPQPGGATSYRILALE